MKLIVFELNFNRKRKRQSIANSAKNWQKSKLTRFSSRRGSSAQSGRIFNLDYLAIFGNSGNPFLSLAGQQSRGTRRHTFDLKQALMAPQFLAAPIVFDLAGAAKLK
jgi:hypothetical protein